MWSMHALTGRVTEVEKYHLDREKRERDKGTHVPKVLKKLTRRLVARVAAGFVEFTSDKGLFVPPCDTGIRHST